jgi:hypothetical protein
MTTTAAHKWFTMALESLRAGDIGRVSRFRDYMRPLRLRSA